VRGRLFHLEGDWYEWRQQPPLGAEVHVLVVPGDGGRLALAELRIVGEPTSELLRAIPVGRIEAVANAQLAAIDDAVVEAPHQRPRRSVRPEPPGDDGWDAPAPAASSPHQPAGRGRPDRFYADVATRYRELAQASRRPAADLATDHDVPVTTAHRWIKEARRRGYLPAGRPGKAG
jgi:hypothetical protein